jgi:signal transduction histidine kinase
VLARDGDVAESAPGRFVAPVVVKGEVEAQLVVDDRAVELGRLSDSLATVANQLALALERERLLATERENADRLAEQNERLRELDRMKDQFVSTVSHELRTPLTSMIGYLELTLEGEAGELNDEQQQFLEIVNRNCQRLNKLIDDILFISRVDAGRLSFDPRWLELGELAEASVESARAAAARRSVGLQCSVAPDLPALWADPTRLKQLIDNLLSNAIKFTSEGGTAGVNVDRHDDSLVLEVRDTGVGIPEDEVGRLFERFFRASTGTAAPGTGLGLSIVKSIVDAHGGTISVESELGVGTTFTVDLPLPGLPGAPAETTPMEMTT